jgi:hypothetical protein
MSVTVSCDWWLRAVFIIGRYTVVCDGENEKSRVEFYSVKRYCMIILILYIRPLLYRMQNTQMYEMVVYVQ